MSDMPTTTPRPDPPTSVRLSELKPVIADLARQESRDLSQMVRVLLTEALAARGLVTPTR